MSLTREDLQGIWREVKANLTTLDGCPDHDFSIDLNPGKPLGKDWRCTRCGGTVDTIKKSWYDQGREHQRKIDGR